MASSQETLPVPDVDSINLTSASERSHAAVQDLEKGENGGGVSSPNNPDAATEERYIVSWDEPEDQDPCNPMNWPPSKKWRTIALLSFTTFLTLSHRLANRKQQLILRIGRWHPRCSLPAFQSSWQNFTIRPTPLPLSSFQSLSSALQLGRWSLHHSASCMAGCLSTTSATLPSFASQSCVPFRKIQECSWHPGSGLVSSVLLLSPAEAVRLPTWWPRNTVRLPCPSGLWAHCSGL